MQGYVLIFIDFLNELQEHGYMLHQNGCFMVAIIGSLLQYGH